jgi:hypothetical protein
LAGRADNLGEGEKQTKERVMSTNKVTRAQSSIQVEQTRPRETPRPAASFRSVLHGGVDVLLAGAQAASTVVGAPMLSAAVARARTGADAAFAGSSSGAAGEPTTTSAPAASESDALRAMQKERVSEDLKLIALQSEIQRHDRQVTLLSNMLKARHDTAKAAIGNIRS